MQRCFVAVVFAVATPAFAQGRSLDEAISVPDDAVCLTREAVVSHTRAWLGTSDLAGEDTILIELGTDERQGAGFVLLRDGRPRARRIFDRLPEPCADRRAALSLALAIALDAGVLARLGVEPPAPPTAPATAPAAPSSRPATVGPPATGDSARREPSLGLHFSVDGGLSLGALPRWSGWGAVGVAVVGPGWGLRLVGWGTTVTRSPLGAGRVHAQLAGATLEACLHRRVRSVSLAGCAGPRLGRLFAEGRGYDMPRATRLWRVAIGAGLDARWPADTAVSVRLGLRAHVMVVRPALRETTAEGAVRNEERLPPVGLVPSLGVVVALR